MYLYASLQLRCYHFLERQANSSLREGVLRAYQSALDIIRLVQERETKVRLLTRGPILFQNALSMASTFTLKVLRSPYSRLVDGEDGRKSFNLSLSLIRKCSLEDHDLPGKFSKILAKLWCATPDEMSQQQGLIVTTRLAGSLLHDAIWKYREKFGDQFRSHMLPTGASVDVNAAPPAKALDGQATELNGLGQDIQEPVQHSQDIEANPIAPVSETFGDVDLDLVNEMNNEWFWNGGGVSSLMAVDPGAMIYPGDFGMSSDNVATLR